MTLVKTKNNGDLLPSVLTDFFNTDKFFSPQWFEREFDQTLPSVNIRETGKHFNIELAAPGFSKSDFKVNVENDVLTISGEKREEKTEENKRYTRKEHAYNSFSRSFTLPQNCSSEKMDAKYENGMLKLEIPKKEETKVFSRKEIKVS